MLNFAVLTGRFTDAPKDNEKVKKEGSKSACSFSLACQRDVSRQATNDTVDFINCVAYDNVADNIVRGFRKGYPITVLGRIRSRNWEGIDGKTHSTVEIVVQKFYYQLRTPEHGPDVEADVPAGSAPPRPTSNRTARFTELADDGELPF